MQFVQTTAPPQLEPTPAVQPKQCSPVMRGCYGDRGIFCRREDFVAVGGYPDLRLFEDAEFYRCLRHQGRTRQLSSYIITSAGRYEKIGPYRLTVAYWLLSLLYVLRVPISPLARIYDRLCLSRDERAGRSP